MAFDEHPHGPTQTLLALRLSDTSQVGLFASLCRDIVSEVEAAPGPAEAREILYSRTLSWQDLLRRTRSPALSPEQQMGLLGELHVLTQVMAPALGAAAVSTWTGPLGAPKDFAAGDVWIEAKAFGAAGRRSVRITSEDQLDDTGARALFLHVLPVVANADRTVGGRTLPEIVLGARAHLVSMDAACGAAFDVSVAAAGFDPIHDYEDLWLPGEPAAYRVGPGFPRIVPGDFQPGPVGVSYDLPLSTCEPWRRPVSAIVVEISGGDVP